MDRLVSASNDWNYNTSLHHRVLLACIWWVITQYHADNKSKGTVLALFKAAGSHVGCDPVS